jgi:glycosidase
LTYKPPVDSSAQDKVDINEKEGIMVMFATKNTRTAPAVISENRRTEMKSVKDIDLKNITGKRTYFPSPEAWEDQILYFLLIDRFSDGKEAVMYDPDKDYENALANEKTKKEWNEYGDRWNGGTIKGITSKIAYLRKLGITTICISPVFRQTSFEETYHGYGIQNFLDIDPHYGTRKDLEELTEEAHKHNMYVVIDIILNHAGNVFRYEEEKPTYNGNEFPVKAFNDRNGEPVIPPGNIKADKLQPDDGIWPLELMSLDVFSKKGRIINWDGYPEYAEGDFFSLKKIAVGKGEYTNFQPSAALKVLTECYKYWLACADIDGFRLDTVKHLGAGATRYFAMEIHEFAETIGKNNFYIIGEIAGGFEFAIDTLNKTGIDAALGINKVPQTLGNAAKGYLDSEEFFNLFKNSESWGEEEHRWYKDNVVTMFDDHDMIAQARRKSRYCADKTTASLLLNALFLNLMSPGIPCIYYGTEQAFDGSGDGDVYVRETMFGGKFGAFRTMNRHFFNDRNPVFTELSKMIEFRKQHMIVRRGRVYQREISENGQDFNFPHKTDSERYEGIIAWSRIFSDEEIVLAINCNLKYKRSYYTVIDSTLHEAGEEFECVYSSDPSQEKTAVKVVHFAGETAIRLTVPEHGCVAYRKKEGRSPTRAAKNRQDKKPLSKK